MVVEVALGVVAVVLVVEVVAVVEGFAVVELVFRNLGLLTAIEIQNFGIVDFLIALAEDFEL